MNAGRVDFTDGYLAALPDAARVDAAIPPQTEETPA